MPKQKVEKGIYFNDKCTKNQYFVQMMVRGQQFYKACKTIGEAKAYKSEIRNLTARHETDIHPLVLKQGDMLVLEVSFQKFYADDEDGRARAKKIATVLDSLMDEL